MVFSMMGDEMEDFFHQKRWPCLSRMLPSQKYNHLLFLGRLLFFLRILLLSLLNLTLHSWLFQFLKRFKQIDWMHFWDIFRLIRDLIRLFLMLLVELDCDVRDCIIGQGVGYRFHIPLQNTPILNSFPTDIQIIDQSGVCVGWVHSNTNIIISILKFETKWKTIIFCVFSKLAFLIPIYFHGWSLKLYIVSHLPPPTFFILLIQCIHKRKHTDP